MYSYRDDDKRTSELGSIGGAIAVTHPLWAVSSPLRVKVSAIVYQLFYDGVLKVESERS